jgi:hypothetical protein
MGSATDGLEVNTPAIVSAGKYEAPATLRYFQNHTTLRRLAGGDSIAFGFNPVGHGIADDLQQRGLNLSEHVRIEAHIASSSLKDSMFSLSLCHVTRSAL